MQSNSAKSKQAKTVQPIKIVNNQVINNALPLSSPEWQQQQKPSKRNLPCSPNSPINIQEKKSKFFSSPNRFSVLSEHEPDTIDNDDTNNSNEPEITQINKKDQPPPIYVKGILNFSNLRNAIGDLIGQDNFTCKSTTTHLKIQPDTPNNYRTLIHFLKDEKAEYHTFQSQSDKSLRAVIKNIHHTTEPTEITSALEEIGFTVRQVTNIKHQKTKKALPLFFVDLAPETISKEIFNITSLLNTKIKVEEPHKRREIPQCLNCQTYGHTRSYCSNSPRCVKCGGTHPTANCTKSPELPAKCALCNGEHPASYKGCIVYKELQQRRRQPHNSRNNNQQQQPPPTNHHSQSINQPTPHPSTQIPRTQHHSYAEVAATNTVSDNYIERGSFPIPIYLGCYSETPNDDENRILKGTAGPYNNNTPQRCLEICFRMGYLYFGNTYGSECWCGNQKPSKSLKVEDINCDSPCSGNTNQFCGGGWKMGIYSTGITDYVSKNYVGCYDANHDDENKTKEKHLIFQMGTNNSPKRCMNLCNTQRFKYSAVKGNICECMNYEPNFSLKRSYSDCYTLCTENPSEYCGGRNTFSIYKTLYLDHQGKVSVNNIGCFKNFKRHPILNGWGIISSNLTPKNCVYSCYARRFPYAALVSSKECLCSFTKPSIEGMIENSMCMTLCSGSSKDTCGGLNAINVYNTGLEWQTSTIGNYYLGCFEESQNNRILDGYSRSFSVNTPEFCSNLCYKIGYIYSGVTYKSECFCGNQSPNEPKFAKLEDKQCNTKCSGDANQFCGGGWRMGVFATGLYDYPIDDRYIGCFVQEENSLNYAKFELINTNVPSKCSAICHNAKYQYAGVMGINCLCSNYAPENNQKVDDANCDTTCVGDSSKTCGGEDRIQIYDLLRQINETESILIPNQMDYDDSFEYLNLKSAWSHDVFVAQEPDYEFVVYNSSESNSFVKNKELVIIPTIQSDKFIRTGQLSLNGCTKHEGTVGCEMVASSYNIIPPVVSAKLTTKNHLLFLYGQVEVIAKLPIGDWIVSEIALISKSNEKNKLVLAKSFGNIDLKCNGDDESATVLKYGLEIDELYHVKSKMMKLTSQNTWHSGYHSFKLFWSPENIVFKIDEESYHLDINNLPLDFIFDSEYFMSIGVSVGGMNNFRDGCLSNGHLKPWRNFETKAMLNFWRDKNYWLSTWNENKSALRVKKVKFTSSDS